jgi:hypothetical protein
VLAGSVKSCTLSLLGPLCTTHPVASLTSDLSVHRQRKDDMNRNIFCFCSVAEDMATSINGDLSADAIQAEMVAHS